MRERNIDIVHVYCIDFAKASKRGDEEKVEKHTTQTHRSEIMKCQNKSMGTFNAAVVGF